MTRYVPETAAGRAFQKGMTYLSWGLIAIGILGFSVWAQKSIIKVAVREVLQEPR